MSVTRYKDTQKKLQAKLGRLRSEHRQLAEENEVLSRRRAVLELLTQHQDAIAAALQQATGSPQPQPADIDLDSSSWPLLHTLRGLNLSRYAQLKQSTTQDVANAWLSHLQQLSLLLHWHERSPEQAMPLLNTAVGQALHMLKAMFILAPHLMYKLAGVNLMTGQHEPPPRDHWRNCFEVTAATPAQVEQLQDLLAVVTPQLEMLEQDRQQLAVAISNMQAQQQPTSAAGLTGQLAAASGSSSVAVAAAVEPLLTRSAARKQDEPCAGSKGAAADSSSSGDADGSHTRQQGSPGGAPESSNRAWPPPQQQQHADSVRSMALITEGGSFAAAGDEQRQQCHQGSLMQADPSEQRAAAAVASHAAAALAAIAAGAGSSSSSSSRSANLDGPDMPVLTREMINQLQRKYLKWRVLSQMRGASTYVLRADQLARLFLGAFPFLPVVGVMFDHIPKQ